MSHRQYQTPLIPPLRYERSENGICTKRLLFLQIVWTVICFSSVCLSSTCQVVAQEKVKPTEPEKQRTLFVPYEDLDILFDGSSQHVYLARKEYEELLEKSKIEEVEKAPRDFVLSAAQHRILIENELATIQTSLKVETLNDRLHAIPIQFQSVYLRSAKFADGSVLPLGKNANGQSVAFLEGKKTHDLVFEFVTIVKVETATQSLKFQLPPASVSDLEVRVNGNVELASGAAVLNRSYENNTNQTRFELVGSREPMQLVMSVNNKKLQEKKSILAKSVFIHELTSNYEQIHARVNVEILYGSTDEVRFELPSQFQITEVSSPEISNWSVEKEGDQSQLVVRLRDSIQKSFALNIAATSTEIDPENWQLKQLKPIGFSGSVSVVGIVAEERFELRSLEQTGLFPIANTQIQSSIPETVFKTTTGAPAIATVAAYYAPDSNFALKANFSTPPAQLEFTPTSILFLSDQRQKLIGQYGLAAQHEKVIQFDLKVPKGWRVTSLKGSDGKAIPYQRNVEGGETRLNIRIPGGIPAGISTSIVFEAQKTSARWIADWETIDIEFPRFDVVDSKLDKGAIAVAVEDDLVVRPRETSSLETLLKDQRSLFGLEGFNTSLTFEIIDDKYSAQIAVDRLSPRITATTYNFFQLLNKQLAVNYEIAFDIQSARARKLRFSLPESTPAELNVQGLNGVKITQTDSSIVDNARIWSVELAEPSLGEIRIIVDFVQPLPSEEPRDYLLPVVKASDVGYQTSLIAFEGNPDFDVSISTEMRNIDVGEMGDAQYVPGARLLGAFSSAENSEAKIDVSRRNIHQLPTTIAQSAELRTVVANNGKSQTLAKYNLLTKASFIELKLPANAKLWAVQLDETPTRPQVRDGSILISLPPDFKRSSRSLTFLYEDQIDQFGLSGKVQMEAPRLMIASDQATSNEIPQADLKWRVTLPSGYTITSNDGTVYTTREERRPLPFESVARGLFQGFARQALEAQKTAELIGGTTFEAIDSTLPSSSRDMAQLEESSLNMPFADREVLNNSIKEFDMERDPTSRSGEAKKSDSKKAEPKDEKARRVDAPQKPAPQQSPVPEPQAEANDDKAEGELRKWFQKGIAGLTVSETIQTELSNRTFQLESLGTEAKLAVTIVDADRIQWLSFAYGGLIIAIGLWLSRKSWKTRFSYLSLVILVAAIVPMLGEWTEIFWTGLENSLYGCFFLTIFYIVYSIAAMICRFLIRELSRILRWMFGLSGSQVSACLTFAILLAAGSGSLAQDDASKNTSGKSPTPVEIPSDAIIIPYDPENPEQESDQIFVPYKQYVELLKKADPTQTKSPPPADFGWTSADYRVTLTGGDLVLQGLLTLESFTESQTEVPLELDKVVLTKALLDSQPAQIKVVSATKKESKNKDQKAGPPKLILLTEGKGKKTLEIELRVKAQQAGGWKRVVGKLPITPASQVTLKLPAPDAELNYRIDGQTVQFVAKQGQEAATLPLPTNGQLDFSWREQATTTRVDQNLSLNSTALFDVRNDGLHLVWHLDFLFRGSSRTEFDVELPKDFSVVRVYGSNIRGWEVRDEPETKVLTVNLLSEAENKESFTLEFSNRSMDLSGATSFPMPTIVVPDAAIHSGQITVRKSDLLDLQTDTMIGISRIDIGEARQVKPKSELLFNPRVFQAFEFSRTPFSVAIRCKPKGRGLEVKTRSLVDIREKSCGLDAQINCNSVRPVHELTIELPVDLEIQNVQVPTAFRRAVTRTESSQTLKLFLASGLSGKFDINVSGRLQDHEESGQIPLPKILVKEATTLSGEIAAIAEPQLIIEPQDLNECESVLLSAVSSWLNQRNRNLARLAIVHKTDTYSGNLKVTRKKPIVSATSITNVNVTLRSIEESVMVSFDIRDAGVDQLTFRVPRELKDARIKADLVREKTVEAVGGDDAAQFQITLQLQDFVIGQYRVLLEQDRGLSKEKIQAPIPSFDETYADVNRFVTVQNSGFDELLVKDSIGLEKLDRRQKPFRDLRNLIGGADIRQGYLVTNSDNEPVLNYQTNPRKLVETVGASIGLSEVEITIDRSGGYRAEQKLYLDNRTEPFLELKMPEGSRLWTVQVAGEPVKPITVEGEADAIRIPLIKTADGDSDFVVAIKYGGNVGALTNLSKVRFPFARTRNINVASSNVKLNLPEDFDFWWFDGTLGVSEENQIQQAKSAYQTALFSKLKSQAKNSKSELVRQRAVQNLNLLNVEDETESISREVQSQVDAGQVDNRDRLNQAYEGQKLILFGNSGNVSNTYGGNFGINPTAVPNNAGKTTVFNDKWFDSNGLVNPKLLEQNRQNLRFNAPAFQQPSNQQKLGGKAAAGSEAQQGGGFGGGGFGAQQGQVKLKAQQEFKKQVADNLNVLQQQSRNARRGGNKKDAILRSYRSQLTNRGMTNDLGRNDEILLLNKSLDGNINAPAQTTTNEQRSAGQQIDSLDLQQGGEGPGGLQPGFIAPGMMSPGDSPVSVRTNSLAVEFQHRGQTYLFQAPSGDLELQVTVVSKSLQRRSINFLVLLGIASVMGCVVWFFGTRK